MSAAPLRLACVTASGELGGAETSLLTLLSALRRLQPDAELSVIVPAPGPVVERCEALGVAASVVPFPESLEAFGEFAGAAAMVRQSVAAVFGGSVALRRYVSALRGELRRRRATVIHSNGIKGHVLTAVAKPDGARLVWHLHDYVSGRPLSRTLLSALARRADRIVANSDSVRADAAAVFGDGRVRRVYNAVDLDLFTPAGPATDLDAAAGMPPAAGCVRVGLVATFAAWKGHDVFLEAVARLPHPKGCRAFVVGGPVYRTRGSQRSVEELAGKAAALGLSTRVGFTGALSDMPAAMRALDVVVHASTNPEPFGMVIAEGMASGRAVVAARGGGAAELFEEGVTAVGHEPGDVQGLAGALASLVADACRRRALGAAARERACRVFEPARMAAQFREVYLG